MSMPYTRPVAPTFFAPIKQSVDGFTDHLAPGRGHNGAAEQASTFVLHTHEAVAFFIDEGSVDVAHGNRDRFDRSSVIPSSAEGRCIIVAASESSFGNTRGA
jgi:hypothetical protein